MSSTDPTDFEGRPSFVQRHRRTTRIILALAAGVAVAGLATCGLVQRYYRGPARLEAGGVHLNRDQVNVAELLRETAARHEAQVRQRGKTLELLGPARSEAASSDSLLTMPADPGRLRHVLDNLIENALIHAGEHGRIALGFERCEGGVRIFVDDDGPGIPDELGQRVFAKFFRLPGTTKQGSGLGLSIVQDIVRAHGGEVGVERSAWGGARFWFSIPLDQARG